jgi:hypothetical protein
MEDGHLAGKLVDDFLLKWDTGEIEDLLVIGAGLFKINKISTSLRVNY